VHAIEDPDLVDYLREYNIPLEVCPTSNICLGIYPDYSSHPFRLLRDAGVPVTINSDDPPLFNTNLNHEACLLAEPFGYSVTDVDDILLNAVRYCCLPTDRKEAMLESFKADLDALKPAHLA
jgi:adenosine deaminase